LNPSGSLCTSVVLVLLRRAMIRRGCDENILDFVHQSTFLKARERYQRDWGLVCYKDQIRRPKGT
jgi:hypothetical protein